MQNQATGCFHLNYFRSLYWKIVPFLHRLIQLDTCDLNSSYSEYYYPV
jgi:hypothetical protein